ncbi:hypothetical protein C0Q70_12578 [Pomacea canaliculata]|uniref:Uncharacterized protein n=1 Tax=Pomacea canaliculata TaxID=400727 RepID=A0A2T7P1Y9_POMCA|nr:hypothetical protein C0Q70_12578 [Pomacea canaliculata]
MSGNEIQGHKLWQHPVRRNTHRLLGDDDCCREWISESRSNFTGSGCVTSAQRARPGLLMTQLDGNRRHNPHPRLATLFHARHGQHDVCTVSTLLPDVTTPEVIPTSIYSRDYTALHVAPSRPAITKVQHVAARGIVPGGLTSTSSHPQQDMLLPVSISEMTPSTRDPNKFIPRRRKTLHTANQHFTGLEAAALPATGWRSLSAHLLPFLKVPKII